MALQLSKQQSKRRPYKVYVKKLENGFGIKTINTLTGVENILILTADSTKGSHSDEKKVDFQHKILRPILSKFSAETVSATTLIPNINKPTFGINKVIAHIEPYLREIKADIAGFHMFEDCNTNSSPNVQTTSVIFVANTESARKKGVHFNIPGKLMNTFYVEGQNKEGKIKFKADSVVKPLTIVVSNYVLHINICYDLPSKPQTKTVGTQTKKRYVLSSSVGDNIPMYKLESSLFSDLQVESEQKFTQTDSSILTEESLPSQTSLNKQQDNGMQTVFFKSPISSTSKASLCKTCGLFEDKSGLNKDEGNSKNESFENSSKQTDSENSLNSFTSYDSHAQLHKTTVLNHMKEGKDQKTASIESTKVKKNIKTRTFNDIKKEKKTLTLTLYDNSSNYNTKTKSSESSDAAFNNIKIKYSSNSTIHSSSKSASFEEYRSKTSVKTANSCSELTQLRNIEKRSNLTIKDEKERLNKTKFSLQQLYSDIELLEKKSDNRSSSETTLQSDSCIEREQLVNKTDMCKQASIVTTNQATSEEFTSIDSSDQSVYFPETKLRRNQSNSTTLSENSLSDYKTSLDILCERCGSFHIDAGFESDCEIFGRTNIKQIKNKDCQDPTNSDSSTCQENTSKNVKNVCVITKTLPDKMESIESTDHFSNKMQGHLETNVKDSTMSCKNHNHLSAEEFSQYNKSNRHKEKETKFLGTDEDSIGNVVCSMTKEVMTKAHDFFLYPEESIQGLVDHHYTLKLSEETFMNKKEFECEREEKPIFDQNFAVFDEAFKDNKLRRECNGNSNNMNSSSENYILKERVKTTAESDKSSQNLNNYHNTLGEHNKDPPYNTIFNKNIEIVHHIKAIEEFDAAQKTKVCSNTVSLQSQTNRCMPTKSEKFSNTTNFNNGNKTEAQENGKVFYFTEVRNSKSWISFKKSLQTCNFNEKIENFQGIKVKTANSELTTNQLKVKNLSTGDHLSGNVLCEVSSSLEERLNTIRLFNNKSNFLNKYSSSSTLHIIPSSLDLPKLKSQEDSFQGIESSKKVLVKVSCKSPNFVRSIGKFNEIEDKNLACTTKYSQCMKFHNNFVPNKTYIQTSNNSKTGKIITKNKCPNIKKHKKSNFFCFFI